MTVSGTRRWWALGALTLGLLSVGLDATVLSVALPTLAGALHASTSDLQWFTSAYTLALAAALLPGGLLGDRFGRKKVILGALTAFGLGSLACAYAPSPGLFIAARVLMGLSAGFLVPLSLSVLTVLFSDEERPRAVGAWAAANFLALPIGPVLGGWLLSDYWWGWVFLMNLPVVAVGLAAVVLWLPESRAARRPGLDPLGVLTSCAGLAVLVYGFIAGGQYGWGSAPAIGGMIGGLAILGAFALRERQLARRPRGEPLVDVALFRSAGFTWGTLLAAAGIFAMFGLLFAVPQYFQAVLGVDAMGSGIRLLPLMGGLAAGAFLAERITALVGAKLAAGAGFAVLTAGLIMGTGMTAAGGDGFIAAWTAVSGLGFGLALAVAATAALAELSAERAGVGSAVMQAVQKTGAPLSAAVLGSVLNSGYRSHLHLGGLPPAVARPVRESAFAGIAAAHRLHSPGLLADVRSAFLAGTSALLWVSAGLALAGLLLALAFLPHGATKPEPEAKAAGEAGTAPIAG